MRKKGFVFSMVEPKIDGKTGTGWKKHPPSEDEILELLGKTSKQVRKSFLWMKKWAEKNVRI